MSILKAQKTIKNLISAVENLYLFRLRSINTAKVWELPKVNLPRLFKKGGLKIFNIKLGKSEKVHGGLFPEEVENNRNKKFFQPMEIK